MEHIPKIYIATCKVTKFQRHRGLITTTTTTTTMILLLLLLLIIIIIRAQGIWDMGEVAPLYGVDSALVLTNPGVQ